LDRKSERIIQETIKKMLADGANMTVLCIAHRLKTIEKADKIWFIEDGKVGTFSEISAFKDITLQ
jgi:ABC-type multidrug transport system fused ATPase/permease subunit